MFQSSQGPPQLPPAADSRGGRRCGKRWGRPGKAPPPPRSRRTEAGQGLWEESKEGQRALSPKETSEKASQLETWLHHVLISGSLRELLSCSVPQFAQL